jgi:hypothetical protein
VVKQATLPDSGLYDIRKRRSIDEGRKMRVETESQLRIETGSQC